MDAAAPLPSLGVIDSSAAVQSGADAGLERKALDSQTEEMNTLLSVLPQPGAYVQLSPAARALLL